MSNVTVTVNFSALEKEFLSSKSRAIFKRNLLPAIEKKIAEAQRQLVEDFESHVVTQEIQGGENSSNISGTLNGRGNLYGFIGFPAGSSPLTPIRNLLAKKPNIIMRQKAGLSFVIETDVPTLDKIEAETPMPWIEGQSWVDRIEKGISGLSHFFPKVTPSSRSGAGIQVKNKLNEETYSQISYMSKIISDFYNKIVE